MKNSFRYDEKFDILSFHCKDASNSYGDESPDNIIFLKDFDTDDLTGITILSFMQMYKEQDKRLEVVKNYFDIKQAVDYCKSAKSQKKLDGLFR